MKKNNLIFAFFALVLAFTSCKNENDVYTKIINFEDVVLNEDSIWNGSDLSGKAVKELPSWGGTDSIVNYYGGFSTGNIYFENSYIPDPYYPSWSGFSVSSKTDTITPGSANQYSVMNSSGASQSKKFAIAYDNATINCSKGLNGSLKIKSMMLTNSTYAYLYMKDSFTTDNWYKVIITGYLNELKTDKVEYYLADFRNENSFISKTWTKVDLSSLGQVNKITISFDSNDKYGDWFNNPTYVCIDNIEFEETAETMK